MNKKFSTLVAALLLSGALFTVDAETVKMGDFVSANSTKVSFASGVMSFTGDVTLSDYQDYLLIDEDNVTIEGNGHALNGRIVVTGKGVTIHNLVVNFDNATPAQLDTYDPTIAINKTAISAYTEGLTITDCKIYCSSKHWLANAITVYPKSASAKIEISNNEIYNANGLVTSDNASDAASAIMIIEGMSNLAGSGFGKGSASVALTEKPVVSGNKYTECRVDYAYADFSGEKYYKEIQISPLKDDSNIDDITEYFNDAIEDAKLVFTGTAAQLQEALGESFTTTANVAVQCSDGNILFGTVENPDNGQPAVIAGVKTMPEKLFDVLELAKEAPSDYRLLVQLSPDPNNNNYYAIVADENGKPEVMQITKGNYATIAANKSALWKMTKTELAGNVYYTFENQNEVTLKIEQGNANQKEGALQPVNNAEYNKGVVFALDGTLDGDKWYLGVSSDKKSIFGLYEAGKNVLTVGNLNYFEQDGFSVTIKYQDADGKFTKEDIAGNEFVGHLTPMHWTGEKFVEALATEEEFYLKNADGDYIVVNAKDAGTSGNNVLYFSTLSEEALEHHLARVAAGDDQEYFGEFKALASASQADPKKLTVIDELQINVNGWLTLGRWDKDETPTLAAATSNIELQPIQIALGSDKIVKAKDLLKKGKFYTVEIVASTEKDDKMIGKKLVAGAADVDNETAWVESYGNVLEGQFALTYDAANKGYIFTNREQLDNAYWFAENSLYTTDEDNEYRWAGTDWTLKIDTVAGHKASDGYQTLADVKNNKFYIGYASGIFGGNAWFVENHEGNDNHVIGLNTNQEDALIFSAKEYAAARQLEKENKETHRYEYIPTDSIYVISTLGYFDGDEYKGNDYKDTLKIVSYTFVNQYTEPLKYNNGQENRLESDVMWDDPYDNSTEEVRYANVEDAHSQAQHFALRIDGTKLNLRKVELTKFAIDETNYTAKDDHVNLYQPMVGEWKLSAGDTDDKGIVTDAYYLSREENDLFVVEPTEKPMYRTVINPLDTISIFRDDNSQSVLFEHNTFLGMENLSQYPDIAKAMIADTAYVRNNTYRPQYMLVVDADITPAGRWCPIHGDDPTCPDAHKEEMSGWVEGRYLVNLVDTAIAWDAANKHKDGNPYINSEKYYRLGFVDAKHINDSLVIASTNDTLYVGSEDYNQAKFAFRYVDQEAGSFVIETANYKQLPYAEKAEINEDAPLGYLKWMNGVVVVVDDINNADVYNMNENETDTPTANEDIAVEEGVEVIAGNGAVTIQGAAGKTVVITNILGKAVANTTLTSDNQTINVPAGIVVVTVDGEAVKAIVK